MNLLTGKNMLFDKVKSNNKPVSILKFDDNIFSNFRSKNIIYKFFLIPKILFYWIQVCYLFLKKNPSIIYLATLNAAFLYLIPAKLLNLKTVFAIRGEPLIKTLGIYKLVDFILPLQKTKKIILKIIIKK